MTDLVNVTGAVTPEFVERLNTNFREIDETLDGLIAPWQMKAAAFAATVNGHYACDTSAGSFTATVPAELSEGDRFAFSDYASTWGAHPLLIDPNGHEFDDAGEDADQTEPMTCSVPVQFDLVFAAGKLRIRL